MTTKETIKIIICAFIGAFIYFMFLFLIGVSYAEGANANRFDSMIRDAMKMGGTEIYPIECTPRDVANYTQRGFTVSFIDTTDIKDDLAHYGKGLQLRYLQCRISWSRKRIK